MQRWTLLAIVFLISSTSYGRFDDYFGQSYGQCLPDATEQVGLWWTSSGWKIGPDKPLPEARSEAMVVRAARNETEAVQLVARPTTALKGLTVDTGPLTGPAGATIPADCIEILECRYVHVTRPTDKSAVTGDWPDPLPPLTGPIDVPAGRNQAFWVRVNVPQAARAGVYEGTIRLQAEGYAATVTLSTEVYDFVLPDRMTCTTAFGFDPGNVYRYQKLSDERDKRTVLEKYWANLSAHHIAPYNLAPLDPIRVTWPDIRPPERPWQGGREVNNEKHSGKRSLLIFDDRADESVEATYTSRVTIPESGLRLRFWYRTAVPGHMLQVTLNHHDGAGQWISGGNNDIGIEGDGQWQKFDRVITTFPQGAKSVRLILRAALWTEDGEQTGLVWFDDVSLADADTGAELIEGGSFEPPTLPDIDRDKLHVTFDFTAWDRAMERAIDHYQFNSFRLGIPGMGGGTFHARTEPQLLGFGEETPHYQALFADYCRQIQRHLREKGWLDEAFVYWFDEPSPKDYRVRQQWLRQAQGGGPRHQPYADRTGRAGSDRRTEHLVPDLEPVRPCLGRAAPGPGRDVLVVRLHGPQGPLLHAVHRPPGHGAARLALADVAAQDRRHPGLADKLLDQLSGLSGPAAKPLRRPDGLDIRLQHPGRSEAALGQRRRTLHLPALSGGRREPERPRPGRARRQRPLGDAPRRNRGL